MNPQFVDLLLSAQNYRDFLSLFFSKEYGLLRDEKNPRVLSYAEFSRRAGFSSRSFIREVILGKKKVNFNNFEKVVRGLKLSPELKDLFKALVAFEEVDFQDKPHINWQKNLEQKKQKVLKKYRVKQLTKEKTNTQLLLSPYAPLVFASSGSEEKGASFEEILRRTQGPPKEIQSTINDLIKIEVLSLREGRYYPCSPHIAIDKLGGDHYFKADYERSLKSLTKKFNLMLNRNDSLFLSSTFCVKESELVQLKQNLNTLLMDFINNAENSEGEKLVELTLGLAPVTKAPSNY